MTAQIYGAYANVRIVSGRITIPQYGLWSADLTLATEEDVPAQGTLTLGDLSLVGAVYRSVPYAGQRHARLVGGFGGWQKPVGARSYTNPAGVPLSLVLGDVAKEVGEKVAIAADGPVGNAYVREAAPASRVLRQLAGSSWWVDPLGTTQVAPRAMDGVAISSSFGVITFDGSLGLATIATETLADWMPGRSFSSPTLTTPLAISSVTHVVEPEGKLRLEVLARPVGTAQDRLMASFRALVRAESARLTFCSPAEYAVQSTDGTVISCSPVDSSLPLPDLVGVPIRGVKVKPTVGSLCVIAFLNADPTRPVVIAVDPLAKTIGVDATDEVDIGATSTLTKIAGGIPVLNAAARANDPVQAGPFAGIIVSGSTKVAVG